VGYFFKNAIVRKPCPELVKGISNSDLGLPLYAKALLQHHYYVEVLINCGLNVLILEADSRFPDSVFIEDIALCTPNCCIIANPGASSRNGEKETIRESISRFYQKIEEITGPGTLDAGDVMMVGNHYFIGISTRTNENGADQLIKILQKFGMDGTKIPLKSFLHLKTGVSCLEGGNLLVSGELVNHPAFNSFNKIIVNDTEQYAANSLWINGKVLLPKGFPETKARIENAGYETIEIDVSEFQKLDGGLSCLSLRF
jgi:dimethylargininase